MFGNHGLCGLLEEGAHEKSPKCLDGNLGDFGGILQRSQTECAALAGHADAGLAVQDGIAVVSIARCLGGAANADGSHTRQIR